MEKISFLDLNLKLNTYFNNLYKTNKKGFDDFTNFVYSCLEKSVELFINRNYKSFALDENDRLNILLETFGFSCFVGVPYYLEKIKDPWPIFEMFFNRAFPIFVNKLGVEVGKYKPDFELIESEIINSYIEVLSKKPSKEQLRWGKIKDSTDVKFLENISFTCEFKALDGFEYEDVHEEIKESAIELLQIILEWLNFKRLIKLEKKRTKV